MISKKENEEKPDNLIASGFIKESQVHLISGEYLDLYHNNYFGEPRQNYLLLEPEEAALLMERGRIKIYSDEKLENEIILSEFIEQVSQGRENFWTGYIVYKDLRSRGYVVRSGSIDYRLFRKYPRGAKPKTASSDTYVLPFAEGTSLELYQFDLIINQAASNRKALILGIIDRSGDVTYYKASEYKINENEERNEVFI